MARHRPCRRTAFFWLSILLVAYAASPALAGVEEKDTAARGVDTVELAARAPPVAQTADDDAPETGLFFRRWVAAGPNIMAADVAEQRRQVVRALQQDQDEREESQRRKERRRTRGTPAAAGAVAERAPKQTEAPAYPAAALAVRQSDGQVAALSSQLQSLSLASSAVSQASRLVSQTSQQLAQQVTQLSQSTDQLSQSIQQLQQSAQQASQSAQQAQQSAQQAQQSVQQAQQSATSAISAAQASAASSASAAVASSLASITRSVASVIAAASTSAGNIASLASSQVQAAKADATVARADAATQVKQAQGAAVSVTQAALAVVGTFVGSVLLTVIIFVLVLRFRDKRRRLNRRSVGYPRDVKLQNPPAGAYGSRAGPGGNDINDDETRLNDGGGVYGRDSQQSSRYSSNSMQQSAADPGFGSVAIGNPPPGRKNTVTSTGGVGGKINSFSLFPKTPTPSGLPGSAIGIAVGSRDTRDMTQTAAAGTANVATMARASVASDLERPPPSLQQWLRQGTVSPFGTPRRDGLETRGGEETDTSWPFERTQQKPQTTLKQPVGGPGKVMRPGGPLPLRDS